MDAASRIIVMGGDVRQRRAVCVPGNQNAAVFLRPPVQAVFAFVFDSVIFGGACRVEYAQIFQRAPDISHKEAGESPERGVEQACLMSVRQIKRYAGRMPGLRACSENNALIKSEGGEEGLHLLRLRTEISAAAFGGVAFLPLYNIVVAVDQIQSVFLMKLFEQPEHIAVNVNYIFHASVFPQFISIAQFDIGRTMSIIMLQRGKIQMLVFQKIIGGGADAPVTVAHKNVARAVRKGEHRRIQKGAVETG